MHAAVRHCLQFVLVPKPLSNTLSQQPRPVLHAHLDNLCLNLFGGLKCFACLRQAVNNDKCHGAVCSISTL